MKDTLPCFAAAAACLALATPRQAAPADIERRPLPCIRVEKAPRIDGLLDEPFWGKMPMATAFSELGSAGTRRAFRQTALRAAYDQRAVYFGVICLEPEPAAIVAKVTERDGPVWLEDAVELFLQSQPNVQRYFHFIINAKGMYYDAIGRDAGWNADITVAARHFDTHWQLEIAIPWQALSMACPKPGTECGFNVAREHRPPDAPEWSTWMPLEKNRKSFGVPECFGRLRFVVEAESRRISFLNEKEGLVANPDFDLLDDKGRPRAWRFAAGTEVLPLAPLAGQLAIANASNYFIAGQKLDVAVKPGQFFTAVAIANAVDDGQIGIAVRREEADGKQWDIYPFWKFAVTSRYALYLRPIVIPAKAKRLVAFNLYRSNKKGRVAFDYVQLLPGLHGQAMLADLGQKWREDRQPIGEPAASPHLPFGRPLAGGSLRALCFVTKQFREAHELAQRLDMDYDLVYCPSARRGGQKCLTCYAFNPKEIVCRLDGLGAKYDVIIVAAKPSQSDLVDKLIAAVSDGVGLVVIDPIARQNPLHPEHWARLKSILPRTRPAEPGAHSILFGAANVHLRRFGAGEHSKGRVVVLGMDAATQGLIPARNDGKCRWWEYDYSLLARVVRWAARREPAAHIESVELAKDKRTLTIAISNPKNARLKVGWAWDHEKLGDTPLKETAIAEASEIAKLTVKQALPSAALHAAGLHLGTVIVRDAAGAAVDWATVATEVTPPVRLARIKLSQATIGPHETVRAEVAIISDAPANGLALRARLIDAFGRTVHATETRMDLPKGETLHPVRLTMDRPLAVYHELVADLADAKGIMDRMRTKVLVPTAKADALDDFQLAAGYTAIPFSPPKYLQRAAVDFMRESGFTCVMPDEAGVRHGTVGFRSSVTKAGARHSGKSHVRPVCFSNPADLKKVVDATVDSIAVYRQWGFVGYTMWDEVHLQQQEASEVCLCEHCGKAFPRWVQRFYKTLPELNRAWGTGFASWDAAKPMLLLDVAKRAQGTARSGRLPNLAQWVDFRGFMEHVWIGMVAEVQAAIKARWPEARLSFTNPYKFGPLSGTNMWLMTRTEDVLLKYFRPHNTPRYRSYTTAPMVSWFGYQSSADECRRFVWWFALNGGVMPIWWDPFDPWEYGGNRGLVAWQCFDPLWRHTGRSQAIADSARDLLNGFGKLLRTAHRVQAQVAILHSQESMHLAYALDATKPKGRKCLYAGWKHSDDAWRSLFDQNGIAYDYVAADGLRGDDPGFKWQVKLPRRPRLGPAALKGYKVLILPYTLALSDRSVDAIAGFVAHGGEAIADVFPGITDEHGTPRGVESSVSGLFGVTYAALPKTWQTTDAVTFDDKGMSALKADATPLQGQLLRGPAADAAASAEGMGRLVFVKRHAKGRSVCLGFVPSAKGPESAAFLSHLAGKAGVSPMFSVTAQDASPARDVETYVYELGPCRFVAIVRNAKAEPEVSTYRTSWSKPSHVYDSRRRSYLGRVNSVELRLPKAETAFLSLMPYKVQQVRVQAQDVRAGARIPATVQIETDAGEPVDHVLHIELRSLDGSTPPPYRWNAVAKRGRLSLQLPTALNDVHGEWLVLATDIASGIIGQQNVRLAAK